jgi:hypothetical protein
LPIQTIVTPLVSNVYTAIGTVSTINIYFKFVIIARRAYTHKRCVFVSNTIGI